MNIGYIGLGLMGKPCARHLMKAGHTVHVWGRHPEKLADLVSEGAIACISPAEVASHVEILFTNLTNTPDVEKVLLGKNGVVESGKSGLVVIDMSTISATATRDMYEKLLKKGIELVDAPVSGGTAGAQNATLTIMVGASQATFDRIQPILAVLGKTITRIGSVGSGQVAKSCNQIVITGTLLAVAEAFLFAQKLGVDPEKVREALLGGFAKSTIMEMHAMRMLKGDYSPGFKTALHLKDIGIVEEIAKELGLHMPETSLGYKALQAAVKRGYGDVDSSILYKVVMGNE